MSEALHRAVLGLAPPLGAIEIATDGILYAGYVEEAAEPAIIGLPEAFVPRGAPRRATDSSVPIDDYWLWALLFASMSYALARFEVPPPPQSRPLDEPGIEEKVDRLRRLVALSGSDNEHEALAAATKVARMLREQGLVEALAEYLGRRRVGVGEDRAVLALLTSGEAPSAEAVVRVARGPAPATVQARRRALRLRDPYAPSLVRLPVMVNWRTVAIVTVVAGVAYVAGVRSR